MPHWKVLCGSIGTAESLTGEIASRIASNSTTARLGNDRASDLDDGAVILVSGDVSTGSAEAKRAALEVGERADLLDRVKQLWEATRGNLLIRSHDAHVTVLASHPSGAFPLFYSIQKDNLRFGTRLVDATPKGASAPDLIGIAGVLLYGYSLNGRTVRADTRRLQPGQVLVCTRTSLGLRIEMREASELWVPGTAPRCDGDGSDLIEELWELLLRAVKCGHAQERIAVMMSGGWDSRTLLGALTATGVNSARLLAYSHGDVRSRELRLVSQLAKTVRCEYLLEPIAPESFLTASLQGVLQATGDAFFPYWSQSGNLLASLGVEVATCGVLGEVMGGHYGASMLSGGAGKMLAVLRYLLGVHGGRVALQRGNVPDLLAGRSVGTRPWCVHPDAWVELGQGYRGIPADIEATIGRLEARGVVDPESLVEAAISELRGGQFICAQPRSLTPGVQISLPFADYRLLSRLSSIPLEKRIHNSLNRALLRRYCQALLRVPTSATIVPANAPILLQEVGRLARKALERIGDSAYSRFGYKPYMKPRLGWVDFEFLRDGNALSVMVESLRAPYWDRSAMRSAIARAQQPGGAPSMHPLSDMLLKVKTIDAQLAGGEYGGSVAS